MSALLATVPLGGLHRGVVSASIRGVELHVQFTRSDGGPLATISTIEARTLAAVLERAADEVERMQDVSYEAIRETKT